MKKAIVTLFLALAPTWAAQSKSTAANILAAAEAAATFSDAREYATAVFQITGTWVATVTFEGTVDGTNYVAVPGFNQNSSASATTTTANGIFAVNCTGFLKVRARVSAYTSGSVVVTVMASEVAGVVSNTPGSASGTVAATQSGTWTARIVGNAGATLDAANDAAAPANVLVSGLETATQGSTQPTAATAGNVRRAVQSTDGAQYVRLGGPVTWSCSLDDLGATLTECRAAPGAGLKLYVTGITAQSTTATAGLFLVRYGTGTNCGTGTASLIPSAATVPRVAYPANTAAPTHIPFATPIPAAANNAVCIIGTVTNTGSFTVTGYTAP